MQRKLIGIITATVLVGAIGAVAWANIAEVPPSPAVNQVTNPSSSQATTPSSSDDTASELGVASTGSQPTVTVTTIPGATSTPSLAHGSVTGSSLPAGAGSTTSTTFDDNGGDRGGSDDSGHDQNDDNGGDRGGSDDSGHDQNDDKGGDHGGSDDSGHDLNDDKGGDRSDD